jgi:hypothetical protein
LILGENGETEFSSQLFRNVSLFALLSSFSCAKALESVFDELDSKMADFSFLIFVPFFFFAAFLPVVREHFRRLEYRKTFLAEGDGDRSRVLSLAFLA